MITPLQPASTSIRAEISPVNAPSRSQCMFCAAICDGGAAHGFDRGGQRRERRRDDDVAMLRGGDQRLETPQRKRARLRLRLVHLPIAGDHGRRNQISLLTAGIVR